MASRTMAPMISVASLTAVALVFLALSLVPGAKAHEAAEELFEDADIVLAPFDNHSSIIVDGTVAADEYSSFGQWKDPDTGFGMEIVRNASSAFVALSNPGFGWIALGFSSDLEEGVGFVALGVVNDTFVAEERWTSNVSDESSLMVPERPNAKAIEAFSISQQDGQLIAELQVSLDSGIWSLEPGVLIPTVVAYNETSSGLPTNLTGGEVHFLRTYLLREQDDSLESGDSSQPTFLCCPAWWRSL